MTEKELLKQKIVETAKEIIAEDGYDNMSMRKIAGKIGYSAGIIYHYFSDKKEIAEIILSDYTGELAAIIREVVEEIENKEKRLFAALKTYINAIVENKKKYGAVFSMNIWNPSKKGSVESDNILKELHTIIAECMEDGIFRNLDTEFTAQAILAAVNGVVRDLITGEEIDEEQRKKLIDHFFYITFKGLLRKEV